MLSEKSQDEESEPRTALAASVSRPTLERAIHEQISQLVGDFSGLESISRFLQTVDISGNEEFMKIKEKLYFAQGAYVRGLKIGDKKNFEKMSKKELQSEVVKQLSQQGSPDQMQSIKSGWQKYFGIMKQFFAMGVLDPDPICILAWYQLNEKVREGFEAAYRGLQICMEEVCKVSGKRRFPINDEDYKEWLRAVHYEVVKGEQNTAVDEKVTTQLIVYASYDNVSLDEDLGQGITLREIFRLSALVSCFDWLSEFYRPEFWNLWQTWHEKFARAVTIAREPLFRTFHRDVLSHRSVFVKPAKIGEDYNYAFEIVNDISAWVSGELKGKIDLAPFEFKDKPEQDRAIVTTMVGAPGCLSGAMKILTDKGPVEIASVCNRSVIKVLSQTAAGPQFMPALPLMTGRQVLYKISTSKGSILATGGHRFFSGSGWKKVAELTVGERLYSIGTNHTAMPQLSGEAEGIPAAEQILLQSLLRVSSKNHDSAMQNLWKILPSSKTSQGTRSSILFSTMRRECKKKEKRNFMPSMWETVHSDSLRSSQILFPSMQHDIQKSNQQPNEEPHSDSETKDLSAGILEQIAKGRGLAYLRGKLEKPQARVWGSVGQIPQGRICQSKERVLQTASGENTKQFAATRSNDIVGSCSSQGLGFGRDSMEMEPDGSCRWWFSFSGFPDWRHEIYDRMQWELLAQGYLEGPRQGGKAGESWLPRDNFDRGDDQIWNGAHPESALVYGIERYGEDFTFDLHVPGTNNYYLANGILSHNSGKTTILSSLAAISILKRKNVVFNPLADNTNWPTYAFLPLMPISKKLYNYSTTKIGTKPTGVPVLVLNIVHDLSELQDETLTRYDRIVKVKNSRSFQIEFPMLIDELGRIAEEFGYSKPTGIITVRNMTRAGTSETTKRFSKEIQVAVNMFDAFNSWRRNHAKIPFRLQMDEIKETGMGRPTMQEQGQLGSLIESAVISARRFKFPMDFAGQVTQHASAMVRELTLNTIFKNLPVERSAMKSPLDILLDTLPAPDEEKDAVRMLEESPVFGKTRLVFLHDRDNKNFNLLQAVPAPFQAQQPGLDPRDIYDYFLKMNKVDPEKFYRRDLKFDWVASGADKTSPDEDEKPEAEEIDEGEAP